MNWMVLGAMLNSALYLSAVFVAGFLTDHRDASLFAVVALGVTYLSYHAQMEWAEAARLSSSINKINWLFYLAQSLVGVSILLCAVAGIALLF